MNKSGNIKISLPDALMSAFAMFSLKDPSLLVFDERRLKDENLKTVYNINEVPCDTQMRKILDDIEPADIEPLFKDVFHQIQRGKALEKMVFMNGHYLLSIDGTGYFSSKKSFAILGSQENEFENQRNYILPSDVGLERLFTQNLKK
ncbi:MAG: hypothetical protein HF967_08015 [Methanosarcinales archaeon]|nr:hypothetical protein [Methanosarcinales archaeon]